MGNLPWTAPWLGFTCDGAYGVDAIPLARWVSARLGGDVLVIVDRSEDEIDIVLFRDGAPAAAPSVPPRQASSYRPERVTHARRASASADRSASAPRSPRRA
jgi:hypothetical protein